MNSHENTQIVQDGYAFFSKGDITSLLNLYADEIEIIFPGPVGSNPFSGTYRGKEQVRKFFAIVNENIKFEAFEPQEFVPHGDKVIVIGYERGSSRTTGQLYEQEWVHILTVRENKVTRLQLFMDTAKTVAIFKQDALQEV